MKENYARLAIGRENLLNPELRFYKLLSQKQLWQGHKLLGKRADAGLLVFQKYLSFDQAGK